MNILLRKLLLLLLLLMAARPAAAQVTVGQTLEPAQLRVGEQAVLTVTVTLGAGERAYFPAFNNNLVVPGVEVVDESAVDTTWLNEGKRMKLTRRYLLTSFDQALYTLPPFEVKVGEKVYRSKDALGLKVDTAGIHVDTLHVDKFYGPHGAVEGVFTWNPLYFWLSLLAVVCLSATGVLAARYFNRRPITRRVVVKPAEQPHKWAIREIEKIKGEKTGTQKTPKTTTSA